MHLHLKVNLRKIMTRLVIKQAKHAAALMVSRLRTKRPEKTFSLSTKLLIAFISRVPL